jgi:hypothetical protein
MLSILVNRGTQSMKDTWQNTSLQDEDALVFAQEQDYVKSLINIREHKAPNPIGFTFNDCLLNFRDKEEHI